MELIKSHQDLTTSWWDCFMHRSNNLSEPKVSEGIFDNVLLLKEIEKGIRNLKNYNDNACRFWNYDGGVYLSLMDDFPLENDETLESWGERVLKGKKYGAIINDFQIYNEELSTKISQLFEPAMKNLGIPFSGMALTLIFGDYDWTPLGIHRDPGERLFHLHAGPGMKRIIIWKDEEAESLNFTSHMKPKNPEFYCDAAYFDQTFDAGALFYMKGDDYHIGCSSGFSAVILVEFYPLDNYKNYKDLSGTALNELIFFKNSDNDSKLTVDLYNEKTNSQSDLIENMLAEHVKPEYRNISMKNALVNASIDRKRALISNGGFSIDLEIKSKKINKDWRDFYKQNLTFSITKPWQIVFVESNPSDLLVYVRGKKFSLKNSKVIVESIVEFNKGKEIDFDQKIEKIEREGIYSIKEFRVFFYILLKHGVINQL